MSVSVRRPIERLLPRIEVDDVTGCWNFTGATSVGYGVLGAGGRTNGNVYAHRVTYEHFIGPIPDGLHIDHLCRNRRCCNPEHLEAVTQAENNRRAHTANRLTHCKRGHEFTPENTGWQSSGRRCNTCHRARCRANYQRRKSAA